MDSISGSLNNINPVSSAFTQRAMRVAQTQVATVKDSKDLKTRDEGKEAREQDDLVSLSHAGEKSIKDKTDSASQSGVMSELVKREKKEKTDEASMFGGRTREYKEGGQTESSHAPTPRKADEISLEDKLEALAIMNRDPDEIRGDVPQAYFDAAQKIVEAKIDKVGKPARDLTALKEVETGALMLKPFGSIEIAGIHDSDNRPMAMNMESSV